MPDESRALQSPVVPDAITSKIALAIEHHSAGLQAPLRSKAATNLVLITSPEGLKKEGHHPVQFGPLVG